MKNIYLFFSTRTTFLSCFLICNTGILVAQTQYTVVDLGTLGGTYTSAYGINNAQQIVGASNNEAFLWENGVMINLGTGNISSAKKINNSGEICGQYRPTGGNHNHSFLWQNGLITDLGTLGGNVSIALGINDIGQIVGSSSIPGETNHGYVWQNGVITDLGTLGGESSEAWGINDLSQVVGYSSYILPGGGQRYHAFLWQNGIMTDIGTFGEEFDQSYAQNINNVGQIVGYFTDYQFSLDHAFLWQNGNVTELGTLGGDRSYATSINDTGQIVGYSLTQGNIDIHPFIWYNGVMTDLNDVSDTTSGWVLQVASDINDHGDIVGHGLFNGQVRAFLLHSGLEVTRPVAGEKWIAGETDTIRWTGGQAGQILGIDYSTDNGITFSDISFGTPADSGHYVWNIPKTILTTKAKIKLSDITDPNINAISDSFKIKPYIITKLDANGDYIAYNINTDRWGFGNNPADMWPRSWFQQFNYQGIDPFTNQQYPQQGFIAFKVAPDSTHPDWVSWVNTYGVSACYFNVSTAVYNINAILSWQKFNSTWNGSCFGISASNALAFQTKNNFQTRYPNFPDFTNPINVMSNANVIPVINELFTHQSGNPTRQARIGRWNVVTPNQTLNEIKSMLREDSVKIRTLSLWNNNGAGGHSILVYSLEQDETQKELYYLFVYDNSYPNNLNALILIDTTGNSNQGTWLTTYGWTTWGGPKKLMLEIESVNYLSNAILPKNNGTSKSPFILEEDQLEIGTGINSNTTIVDMQGNITGFINGQVFEEIPESVPLIYLNGSETPPYGYSLQTDNYSVVINEIEEEYVEAFFFTGNKSFVYERDGASVTQTDRLFFDGGVSAVNPDAQNKTISLLNLINETTQEKLAVVSSLELAQNDSVKIENPDSNKVKLISYGSAKDYDIDLNYSTANGIGRFANSGVILTANTSHTFIPDWTNLSNSQLVVLVDVGNNGTIDDTLHLNNTVGIEDEGNLLTPNEYNLAQNYPNPFNPTTTIGYSIPQRSNVVLKVYDILGNEVSTLVNEEKERGVYTIKFDASQLASGIYLYRLQAGSFIETKKMILLR